MSINSIMLGSDTVEGWQNALVPQGESGPLLSLAASGESNYSILLESTPSSMDEIAATTLARYLKTITGAEFPVVQEGEIQPLPDKVISIGRTELFENSGLAEVKLDLADEGYAIVVQGETLFLLGGKVRGAIYAVYSLLEEDLGCRFYTSEPDGEWIPRIENLEFRPTLRHYVPVLNVRDPFYQDAFDVEWSLKNKTNAYKVPVPEAAGGHAKHAIFVHSYNDLVPPSKYFDEHPEYFAEVNGYRQPTQLELTNPDVLRIAIESVKQFLRDHPGSKYISVSPNDGYGYSESAESRAIDEAEATVLASKSGTLLKFVNGVAEAIEPEFPDVKISTLAYLDTFMPPKTIRPHENVVCQLCTDSHAWKYQFCFICESETFQNALKAWHAIGTPMYIWDYTTSFAHYMVPTPNMPLVTDNIRFYIEHGAKGVMLQGNYNTLGGDNSPMRSWVWAKQLWNPALDTKALMRDFIFGYYAEAAEPIWEYNIMLWQMWEEHHSKAHQPGETTAGENPFMVGAVDPNWPLLDQNYIEKTTRFFEQAEALSTNPITLRRVETAKLVLLYVQLGQGVGHIADWGDFKAGSWLKSRERDEATRKYYQLLRDEFVRIAKVTGVTQVSEWTSLDVFLDKLSRALDEEWVEVPVVRLDKKWRFKTDAGDIGLEQGWHRDSTDEGWSHVYCDRGNGWESQGFATYRGAAWYSQNVVLPDDFESQKKLYLYFGAVDSECEIYLNGKKIFEHTMQSTGLAVDKIWNAPFAIDVTEDFNSEQTNIVAVRATSFGAVRGVWKPAFLVATRNEMTMDKIQDAVIPYR